MNVYAILGSCFGAFALLHFLVLPRAESALRASVGPASAARAAGYALIDLCRSIALLATISCAAVIAGIWVIDSRGGTTAAELGATLETLRAWRATLREIDPALAIGAIAVIAVGLAMLARRRSRLRFAKAFEGTVQREANRVFTAGREGKWDARPPTAAMAPMLEQAGKLEAEAELLRAALAQPLDETGPEHEVAARKFEVGRLERRAEAVKAELAKLNHMLLLSEVERRMEVRFNPSDLLPPKPTTLPEKLQTLLISRGLLSSLNGASRVAFIAGMLLLMPSLLALSAPTLEGEVARRVDSIDELRIAAEAREAEESWAKNTAAEVAQPSVATTAEDNAALDALSRRFEVQLAGQFARFADISVAAVRPALTADIVRHHDVRERILHADVARISTEAPGLTPAERDLAHLQLATAETRGPVTEAGLAFREQLDREMVHGAPRVWASVKHNVLDSLASFQRPVGASELEGMLFNRLVGAGASGISPDLADIAAGLDINAIRRGTQTRAREVMVGLTKGDSPDDAFKHAFHDRYPPFPETTVMELRTAAQRMPPPDDVSDAYRHSPPSFSAAAEHGDPNAAAAVAREMGEHVYQGGPAPEIADALATYADHFPGMPAARASAYVATRAELGVTEAAAEVAAREAVQMSRSFISLIGFRRIGGVLIGRPPEAGGAMPDIRSIDWRRSGNEVRLTLVRADKVPIRLGPYRPEIVHLALAYAADGRPITTTMVTATPLRELKIMLHPALTDTALGCRAINVDRFVDTYAGAGRQQETPREAESRRILDLVELYRWAWAVHLHVALRAPGFSGLEAGIQSALDRRADRVLDDSDVAKEAAAALDDIRKSDASGQDPVKDPTLSPLAAKPNYFAPVIVDAIRACARATPDEAHACLEARGLAAAAGPKSGKAFDWSAPPPEIEIWSGVRESPFKLDGDLAFAQPAPPTGGEPSAALRFILQISFKSPPYLADPKRGWLEVSDKEIEAVADADPWQFPMLQRWIDDRVSAGIAQSAAAKDVLSAMEEFTLLQRLFRLALDGRLGQEFPIERLAQLAEASAGWVRQGVHTPRWNARPGALEESMWSVSREVMARGQSSVAPGLYRAAQTCVAATQDQLDSFAGRVQLARMPHDAWETACGFSGIETAGDTLDRDLQDIVTNAKFVAYARQIRQALAVTEEDAILLNSAQGGEACPPF